MQLQHAKVQQKAKSLRLMAFDVDGVMTDGGIILGPAGTEYKRFHVRDGHGLVSLAGAGVNLAIITGRRSDVVSQRMRELNISHVFQGVKDKLTCLKDLAQSLELDFEQVGYMGDDLPDLDAVRHAGLGVAVADACAELKRAADAITSNNGGDGAVRELCEFIIAAKAGKA